MTSPSYELLLEQDFLETAMRRSHYLERSDPDKANEMYDHLHALKNKLRTLPDRGEAVLKRIISANNVQVKIMAAAALLAVDEPFALKILEAIAALDAGLDSSDARLTAEEWMAGRLREHWK